MPTRIAILASGSGTNAQALIEASSAGQLAGGEVVVVISDKQGSGALERASNLGVEAVFVDPSEYSDRPAYGDALIEKLIAREVSLVCNAGFMKILPPRYVYHFKNRALNVHPSLLPSFPGMHPVRDALAWGAKVTGTTIHFVDEETDHGPIVMQEAVRVLPGDDEPTLHERIKAVEHRLYPEAVRAVVSRRVRIEGRTVHIDEPQGANA